MTIACRLPWDEARRHLKQRLRKRLGGRPVSIHSVLYERPSGKMARTFSAMTSVSRRDTTRALPRSHPRTGDGNIATASSSPDPALLYKSKNKPGTKNSVWLFNGIFRNAFQCYKSLIRIEPPQHRRKFHLHCLLIGLVLC